MTGAFDQTSAAASRLSPDLGKFWLRIELASRGPSPAPVICSRQAAFSPVPASRMAATEARIMALSSGTMSVRTTVQSSMLTLAVMTGINLSSIMP